MNPNRLQIRWHQESGGTIVLISVGMVAFLMFAALSIDVSHLYQQQRDIQSATDAGALAAAALLTNPPPADSVIRQEAINLASANGVSTTEIAASNFGTVELGEWDGTTFTAGTKPYNAVLVPAKRTVGLFFAPVAGLRQKLTAVHSVAVFGNKTSSFGGNSAGLIPFGLDLSMLDQPLNSTVTITKDNSGGGSGNFGELDFSDRSVNNGWSTDMSSGCDCTYSIGDQPGVNPGKNGNCGNCIANGFSDRLATGNPDAVLPVIGTWPNGNSGPATIVGFIGVKIISSGGQGSGWAVTLQIVSIDLGGGTNGVATSTPFASRELVQ